MNAHDLESDAGVPVTEPKRGAKPDELALWERVKAGDRPRDAGRRLEIPEGRVAYLCMKWAKAGIYEYGVTVDMGWPSVIPPKRDDKR